MVLTKSSDGMHDYNAYQCFFIEKNKDETFEKVWITLGLFKMP